MPIRGTIRFESVTVAGTAIGMTITRANGMLPEAAVVQVEDAAIRFRIDGNDPTASVGHSREVGQGVELVSRDEVQKFRAIRRDGVSATLRITQGIEYLA